MLNSKGKDVVIGTAVFEGYLAGKNSMMIPAAVSHSFDFVYAPSALQSVRASVPDSPCACLCCLCTFLCQQGCKLQLFWLATGQTGNAVGA